MIFLDCFAGGGLGRIGMGKAGHRCVGYIEIDKYARQAYEAYFDTAGEYTCHDIRTADPRDMPDFDCFLFGWPCQDNSIAGLRAGQKEGTRSGLLYNATGILRAKRPRYFIAENVKGLYTNTRGVDFYATIQEFTDSGYDVQWQLLNSIWFLPQNRERFYFVGHLAGTPRPEVFPIGEGNEISAQQSQGQWDSHGNKTLVIQRQGGYRNSQNGLSVYQDSTGTLRAHPNGGNDSIPIVIQQRGGRLRRLTPLECFRLQGAPDEYFHKAKEAGISDTQLYKIAGNGMSVPVVYEIARKLSV